MKAEIANSKRPDILGDYKTSSDQETLDSLVRKWRQKLGYCSIFAAIPALLASHLPSAHSDEAKLSKANVGSRRARLGNLNKSLIEPALLKRQSAYLLPHQQGSFGMLAVLAGNDDCPGRTIPAGSYLAASPFIDSGDTTGANDTVTRTCFFDYCYGFYVSNVPGPDHIYSFTLAGRGADPQIRISRTSGAYEPVAYILNGTKFDGCPRGTSRTAGTIVAEGVSQGGTSTIDRQQMDLLPLNVPLHLFVDSAHTDTRSSGSYTIRIQDVAIGPAEVCPVPNPIDCADVFVGRHYIDFLNRAPDPAGLAFWTNEIDTCATDAGCIEVKRINVSAAFFLSIEFQETGYLVYRMSKVSRGNLPGAPVPIRFFDFLSNTQQIGRGVIVNQAGWELVLENNKQAFASELVGRASFSLAFPLSMTPSQFVDQIFANAEITPGSAERAAAVNEFGSAITSVDQAARARALRLVAENATLRQKEFNRAFVLMQYFGYLRRNPNDAPDFDFQGYNFWLGKLNQFNGNFVQAEMVKSFLLSSEYRQRFGP